MGVRDRCFLILGLQSGTEHDFEYFDSGAECNLPDFDCADSAGIEP